MLRVQMFICEAIFFVPCNSFIQLFHLIIPILSLLDVVFKNVFWNTYDMLSINISRNTYHASPWLRNTVLFKFA
jgi:hypothetical protein